MRFSLGLYQFVVSPANFAGVGREEEGFFPVQRYVRVLEQAVHLDRRKPVREYLHELFRCWESGVVNILCEIWVVGDPLSTEVDCHVVCVDSWCELCLVELLWVVSRERGFLETGVFGVVEVEIDRYTLRIFWIETVFR